MYQIKTTMRSKGALLLALFLCATVITQAQLKIGDNPTSIQKSSILELESTKQGLLLPRLSDTAGINALTPPDGMIIFLTADSSLRIRRGAAWVRLASLGDATANWAMKGNAGTDSATQFIGTVDNKPLTIRTDNNARMIISSTGNVGIGTTTPSARLNVDGSVKFDNLASGSTELDVLVINPDGSVYKRAMSSSAFENAIKAINGIQKQSLTIKAGVSTSVDTVTVTSTAADSTIAIYLPVQDGSSATDRPYGFLTHGDWEKIQSAVQTITIGTVATSGNVKGASINISGTSREIVLHAATATTSGIVTDSTQTFGGVKTFQDSVTAASAMKVGSSGNANSTVQVDGSLAMAIRTVTASATISGTDNTILANTSSASITLTLPAPGGIAGRIYTIKKIGNGGIDNELTITPNGGTIDGGNSYKIYNDYTYVTLQTDGTNWYIIKK